MADKILKDTPPVDDPVAPADKLPVDDLIARATDFLGYPSYVAAGALSTAPRTLSIDDAKGRIVQWLSTPVTKEA